MTAERVASGRIKAEAPRVPVAVVDYGAGNLVSIEQALVTAGADVRRVERAEDMGSPALLVVPGVGASAPAMERLEAGGFVPAILDWIAADRPFFGICLGLQLLFETSDEDGAATLGILRGHTVRLEGAPTLPHIGWNQVERQRDHPAFEGIAEDADFYFVHSYAGAPEDADVILAETEHGRRFTAAVARGRMLGVQFHPERSGVDGLRLVANIVRLAAEAA